MEFGREFKVALVVGWDGHDGACAVAHEDIVGDPDGDFVVVDGVDGKSAGEDAAFFLVEFGAVEIALGGDGGFVFFDCFELVWSGDGGYERMLGRKDHIGRAEEGVWACREDFDSARRIFDLECDQCSFTAADPVLLEKLDSHGPIEAVESLQKTLGEGGDAEHPLAERSAFDGKSADFAFAVDDFLVGQHSAEFWAPVHRHFGYIGEADGVGVRSRVGRDGLGLVRGGVEPGVVELEENPLCPPEIAGVGGADFAVPIVAEAHGLELAAEVVDIAGCGDARVLAGFDGVLLGGQAEGIPAHGVEDVEPLHAVEARQDVRGGVALDVPDMKPVATGVGEHVENVVFRLGGVEIGIPRIGGMECFGIQPMLLPAGFEFGEGILLALRAHFGKSRRLCGSAGGCKPIRVAGKAPRFDGLTTERTENKEEVVKTQA